MMRHVLVLLFMILLMTGCSLQAAIDRSGINTVQPTSTWRPPVLATSGAFLGQAQDVRVIATQTPILPTPQPVVIYVYPTPQPTVFSPANTPTVTPTPTMTPTATVTPTPGMLQVAATAAFPWVTLCCASWMIALALALSVQGYRWMAARADAEQAQAIREAYLARVIETAKGVFWISDSGQPVALTVKPQETRFITVNTPQKTVDLSQETQDVLAFLELAQQRGYRDAEIPSRSQIGMAAGTWQRLKHLLSSAKDSEGKPLTWVAASSTGTAFVGGWTVPTACEALECGDVRL